MASNAKSNTYDPEMASNSSIFNRFQKGIFANTSAEVQNAKLEIQMTFVRQAYGTLATQLFITAIVGLPFMLANKDWVRALFWLPIVAAVFLTLALLAVGSLESMARKWPYNYIFFFYIAILQGLVIGPLSAEISWQSGPLAIGVTIFTLLMMVAFTCHPAVNFNGLQPYLYMGFSSLCGYALACGMIALCDISLQWLRILWGAICMVPFTTWIVFDTQMILNKHGGHRFQFEADSYVFAILVFYADIIKVIVTILTCGGTQW